MDSQNHEEQDRKDLKEGIVHLILFLILIIAGIVVKRGFGHPEYMMVFHGPAAVFLVIGGMKISSKHRRKFKSAIIDD